MHEPVKQFSKLLAGQGTLSVLGGNKPFGLKDPGSIWLVEKGAVDVFAMKDEEADTHGVRRHLFRVPAGEILCGMQTNALRLEACATSGSAVRAVPKKTFATLANGAARKAACFWLENWILRLSGSLRLQNSTPEIERCLVPGVKMQLMPGEKVNSRRGVVWVSHEKGSSRLFSREQLPPVNGQGYFPVVRDTWLEALENTSLNTLGTGPWLDNDPQWKGLTAFHNQAVLCLHQALDAAALTEEQRLENRKKAEISLFHEAIVTLAGLEDHPSAAMTSGDALLTACRLVGNQASIQIDALPKNIKTPSDLQRQEVIRNNPFRIRKIALEGEWWRCDNGPFVGALTENETPVALLPVSSKKYEMVNGADGSRTVVTAEKAAALSPEGYKFYASFPAGPITVKNLFSFASRGRGSDILTLFSMGALGGLIGLAVPVTTGVLINRIIPGAQIDQMLQVCLALFLAAVAGAAFDLTRGMATLRYQGRADERLQAGLWDHLLKLPVSFFKKFTAGELTERIMGIDHIQKMISGQVLHVALSAAFSVLNLALIFYYSASLALCALCIVLVVIGTTTALSLIQLKRQRQLIRLRGKLTGMVLQFVTAISKLRVAGAEKRAFLSWSRVFSAMREVTCRAGVVTNVIESLMSGLPILSSMIIFTILAMSELRDTLSLGAFLAFNAAFGQFLVAGTGLSTVLTPLISIIPAFEEANIILKTKPEVDVGKNDPGKLSGEIEVRHLSFRYDGNGPLILKNVSLAVKRGEFVAIVGPSGSGKSTLLRLLLGFEQPDTGAVYYDKQELSSLDILAVRRQFGVILQNGQTMPGDLFSNIAGAKNLTLDDAWRAARQAGIEKDIKEMPMQMHTVIPQGGGTLSGGQRQRLLIARALATRPEVIFMDEATSALDALSQKVVQKSMEALDVTRVVIAHRLSTIRHADRIVAIVDGKVAEAGTYDELMAKNGVFASLAKRQMS